MDHPQPQNSDAAQWYYLREGDTCGPIAATHLRHLVVSGQLSAETLVWRDGMRDWLPANELGLTSVAAAPVPPPVAARGTNVASRGEQMPVSEARHGTRRSRGGASASRVATARRWAWIIAAAVTLLGVGIAVGWVMQSRKNQPMVVAGHGPVVRQHVPAVPDMTRDLASAASALVDRKSEPPRRGVETSVKAVDRAARLGPLVSPLRDPGRVSEGAAAARGTRGTASGMEGTRRGAATDASGFAPPPRMSGAGSSATDSSGRPPVLYQLVTLHRRPSYGMVMKAMSQDIQYTILSQLNLQPRLADGSFRVMQRVLGAHLDRSDEMSQRTYETSLAKLVGKQFVFTLNAKGEVLEFDGYESDSKVVTVTPPGGTGYQLVNVLDKDGWKELIQLSFLEPAKHIAPGQNWTRQMGHDWSPLGRWTGTTTFSQDTTKGPPLLYFNYKHDMTYTPAESAGSVLPFSSSGLTFRLLDASGTFVYDPTRQYVTHVDESFHVKGTVGIEGLGAMGKLEIEERQQTTIRLTTQNPWARE